jgi:hypothetical protein
MKASRRTVIVLAVSAAIFGIAVPAAIAQSSGGSPLPSRSSNEGGVQVVVKPEHVEAGSEWTFSVTLNTHTKPLTDDMTKAAVLVDDGGKRYSPLSWQGDKPGGHHRKGTLRFPAPAKQPKSFELRIDGIGGVQSRAFKWTMK